MRVLHVEDNLVYAHLASQILGKMTPNISLETVSTLAAAREKLLRLGGYDLALLDLNLPDGNGLGLLAEIRERQLPMAVVVLTGCGDQAAAIAALQAGADDYLAKGGDGLSRLPATVRDAWKRHQAATARRSHPLHVLYAEHNADDVSLIRQHLARRAPHIRITEAQFASQVLELLPSSPAIPSIYDVVLLGYRLPDLDALELFKALRIDRGLEIPIVMIAGQGNENLAVQAIHLGVDDYIAKHSGYLHELPSTLEKVHREAELVRERGQLQEASLRLNHLLTASPVILYTLRLENGEVTPSWVSENITRLLGYSVEQALMPDWWRKHLYPGELEAAIVENRVSELLNLGRITYVYRFLDSSGQVHWIHDELLLLQKPARQSCEALGVWRDITEIKQAEQVQQTRIAALDRLVTHQPLPTILEEIAIGLEKIRPDMRVSILLRDPITGLLRQGAGPSLPAFFNAALNGLKPEIGCGVCGTAAASGGPVIVEDLRSHPYGTLFAELAAQAGLHSCWSIPFKDEGGQVLGTFGIYYGEMKSPSQADRDLVDEFSRLASLAVRRVNSDAALRQAAAVFASTREGVLITDLRLRILAVNRAYTEITGYSESESLGRKPSLLRSGLQDAAFYQAMWKNIHETGHWQGEIWNKRKSGETYPQLLTISTVFDDKGQPSHYVGVMTDISQLKNSQNQLQRLAHYDPLTELPNRVLVQLRLRHALERAEREGNRLALMFIDLDRFKNVNDSLGHPAGDKLLELLAQRLRQRVRGEDTLGRWGGDEFLLVLEKLHRLEDAAGVARDLIQLLEQPFALPGGHDVYIGASIGISLYPENGQSVTELIQHADVALYKAKEHGRNTFRFYTPVMTEAANERLDLEARLRRALANGEFILHYQPQIDIQSGALVGCEALVRWYDPIEGIILPTRFIPLAEETGLIASLGEWVLLAACTQAQVWRNAGFPPLTMSVNLSGRQLCQGIVKTVSSILEETGLPAKFLKLELTESMIMGQGEVAIELMHKLKELGNLLSIDDFGTGYSSLSYLKRFPIDDLKIDQGFVRDIPSDKNSMEIAATIIAMARNLNLRVTAEGVETPEQLAFLSHYGCHVYQGFLFSQPLSADQFTQLLKTRPVNVGSHEPVT